VSVRRVASQQHTAEAVAVAEPLLAAIPRHPQRIVEPEVGAENGPAALPQLVGGHWLLDRHFHPLVVERTHRNCPAANRKNPPRAAPRDPHVTQGGGGGAQPYVGDDQRTVVR